MELVTLASFSTSFLVHIWPGNYIVHRVPLRIMILNSSSEWEITVFFETTAY